jgi:lipooligosaccharide transport system permease protein
MRFVTDAPPLRAYLPHPRRAFSVWRRNSFVWRKLLVPSLLANFGEPLLYLLAFGYGFGTLVHRVGGLPYITFLATGIACSSAMNAASFEALYSTYTRMDPQKTWEGIHATPLTIPDIVFGELLWAGTKGLINALAILIVAVLLGLVAPAGALLALPVLFLSGLCFAALALVATAFARGYDFFTYYFTLVLTPLLLVSGVFFPIASLPPAVRTAARLFPLAHTVTLVRPLLLGRSPPHPVADLAVLVLYTAAAAGLAFVLFVRRFER